MTADILNTDDSEKGKTSRRPRRDDDDEDRYERYDHDDDRKGGEPRKFLSAGRSKRKACRFCTDKEFVLDYKNIRVIQTFMTEHGKIVPRRISGTCATHQRALTTAVKRARQLALVGYVSLGV